VGGKNSGTGTKPTDISKRFRADFLENLDGRVAAVKTLHERLSALVSDLGGFENLSYQEKTLCKRVVHLERLIEKKESTLVNGGTVDVHEYLAAVNSLAGLLTKIGLRRRAKQVPSLSDYVSGRTTIKKEDS
jgi:hypothetical protein